MIKLQHLYEQINICRFPTLNNFSCDKSIRYYWYMASPFFFLSIRIDIKNRNTFISRYGHYLFKLALWQQIINIKIRRLFNFLWRESLKSVAIQNIERLSFYVFYLQLKSMPIIYSIRINSIEYFFTKAKTNWWYK
jgi:hypothetical protein